MRSAERMKVNVLETKYRIVGVSRMDRVRMKRCVEELA